MDRLQKIIAARGYCSRRRAEDLIAQGIVKVNGIVVNEMGQLFAPDVAITIDGKPLIVENEKYYYLFHKPRMVVTTMSDPQNRRTVADFFKDENHRLFPVGRLDYDVSGALIMTNDGEFADYITHPRYGIRKTYQAMCQGKVGKHQIKELMFGVHIDDDNYFTKALDAGVLKYDEATDTSIVFLIIAEGRKHHVKKMLIAANIELIKLKRIAIEFLNIADVVSGTYRPLKPHEVKQFYGIFKGQKIK